MEVERLRDGLVPFGDLNVGDTFVVEHIPYIVIDQNRYNGVNATSLFSGRVVHFENEDYVEEAFFKLVKI